jgi:uncharacterized membrane protein YfcA
VLVAAIAAFVGAALQSTVGFGFALVAGPALFGFLEPTEALTTLIILGTGVNLLVLFGESRPRQVRRDRVAVVLAWSLPGLALGAMILAAISKSALQIAVGAAVIAAVAVQAHVQGRPRAHSHLPEPGWAAPVAGFTTGVLATTTGTSGPPLVLWFQRLEFSPAEFRDSLAVAFLALNVFSIFALLAFGDGVAGPAPGSLLVLAGVTLAGQLLGRRLFDRLDPGPFRTAGLLLVLCAGIASVVAGVAAAV